ncbi:MAG: thioredoxin family protein [Caldilineaceae bacterium]
MLERFIILLLALFSFAVSCGLWRFWLWRRTRTLAAQDIPEAVAQLAHTGPALLYFTTQQCAQCRFQQTPILKQLAAATDVTIHTIDAVEQEALARFYGIMTVPSTIWLDKMRRPATINHGLTGLTQLRQQAQDVYAL